ncbi:peptidoglycan-binding protein [Devosia ginsengisoli]|uniref:Peptidoglycan-binding protein n=2 Tax=Devosia ginsengisoli TaxID=400770 RepID=A0A5B8LQL5_9HYPH|nr:peptidoglycan-binding protein [Devosia ginsengisoli]
MLHGTTSGKALRIAALIACTGLMSGPAFAKAKPQQEAARQACIGAFGDHDHFDWVPRMGLENALSACQFAIGWFPDDPDVQFYNAVARDQFAERGGDQQDNLYATAAYRRLAEQGLPIAQYALSTMFDEDSGVSTEDALDYMKRARDGEFGVSISCEALRTFGYSDLDGNGPNYDVAAAESAAHDNYVCAGYLANMVWNGYASASDLPLPLGEYARYAAVHGDPAAMTLLGLFYAFGTGSTEIGAQLQGQYTARQDAERAGYWLLLAYWGTKSAWSQNNYDNFWGGDALDTVATVEALQTALKALGRYDGAVDGVYGADLYQAVQAFGAADVDALFQMVRAKEKYASSLGPREEVHIGDGAMPE